MSFTVSHVFTLLILCTQHCLPGRTTDVVTATTDGPNIDFELTVIPYKVTKNILFDVESCNLSLATLWDENDISYTIETDPANNTITIGLCVSGSCDNWGSVASAGFSCLQSLWVRWDENILEVGTGRSVGEKVATSITPVGNFIIKTIKVSSHSVAEWKFATCCDDSDGGTGVPVTPPASSASMTSNNTNTASGNVSSSTSTSATFMPAMSPLRSGGSKETSQYSGFIVLGSTCLLHLMHVATAL